MSKTTDTTDLILSSKIRPGDVLFGRGQPFQRHKGNKKVHELAEKCKDRYRNARRDGKRKIIEAIVKHVQNEYDGRFLKPAGLNRCWMVVSPKEAENKVRHTVRSRLRGDLKEEIDFDIEKDLRERMGKTDEEAGLETNVRTKVVAHNGHHAPSPTAEVPTFMNLQASSAVAGSGQENSSQQIFPVFGIDKMTQLCMFQQSSVEQNESASMAFRKDKVSTQDNPHSPMNSSMLSGMIDFPSMMGHLLPPDTLMFPSGDDYPSVYTGNGPRLFMAGSSSSPMEFTGVSIPWPHHTMRQEFDAISIMSHEERVLRARLAQLQQERSATMTHGMMMKRR